MVNVTELNRGPDISANAIYAASVSADSSTVGSLEADGSLSGPTASEGDVVTLPDNPDVVPIYFDAQTGEPLYPDLEETV